MITLISKIFDVGFSVKIKDKNIDDAEVFCDNMKVNWEEQHGKEKETKNLRVGGIAFFIPSKLLGLKWSLRVEFLKLMNKK